MVIVWQAIWSRPKIERSYQSCLWTDCVEKARELNFITLAGSNRFSARACLNQSFSQKYSSEEDFALL
jgi:hypothetical protein